MKNIFKKIWEAVTLPLISVAVMVDDSMRYDESWESYWTKKNERG